MKSLRFAFVSSHPSSRRYRRDASFIYRCENLSLSLIAMGHEVSLLHIRELLVRKNFDVVVFLRPVSSWIFKYVVWRLKARGVTLIGDVDDLIFDPACAEFRPSVRNDRSDKQKTEKKFISHARALEKMDVVQFSTRELANRYAALHPGRKCEVIPNAAHRSWYGIEPLSSSSQRCISYFSGTRTHDRDLALVAPVLERLLQRHEDLILKIVGPVSIDLQHPRVQKIQKVAFRDYSELVRTSHLCIAPLEDTPFNQCKSALKAFEASALNVPVIASPVGEYSEIHVKGLLHAASADEWESQLEYALDPVHYKDLSTGLRERMREVADIDEIAEKFLEFVSDAARDDVARRRSE